MPGRAPHEIVDALFAREPDFVCLETQWYF